MHRVDSGTASNSEIAAKPSSAGRLMLGRTDMHAQYSLQWNEYLVGSLTTLLLFCQLPSFRSWINHLFISSCPHFPTHDVNEEWPNGQNLPSTHPLPSSSTPFHPHQTSNDVSSNQHHHPLPTLLPLLLRRHLEYLYPHHQQSRAY